MEENSIPILNNHCLSKTLKRIKREGFNSLSYILTGTTFAFYVTTTRASSGTWIHLSVYSISMWQM
jgi:hypothetical protein